MRTSLLTADRRLSALTARQRLTLAGALMVAALALRLLIFAHYPYAPINDARTYLRSASAIAHTGTYQDANHAAGGTHGPSAYFPPAYSYLLALADLITGGPALSSATVTLARLIQVALGTGSVALLGLSAFELFGSGTALTTLALGAIYPVALELSAVLAAENLLTLLELAALYAVLRAGRSAAPSRWLVSAGVLIGLAALTHSNALVLLVPLGFGAQRLGRRPGAVHRALPARAPWVTLLVCAALTVTPWMVRNLVVMGGFVPISSEAGITLAGTYNSTSARSDPPYRWVYFADVPSLSRYVRLAPQLTELQLSSRLESAALGYVRRHPLAPLSVGLHNTLRLLELEGSAAWRDSAASIGIDLGLAQIGVVSFWIVALLALAGALTRAARDTPRWVWGVPLAMWLSVVLVNAETPRFREPIDPFLILLAACALNELGRRLVVPAASAAAGLKPAGD